MTTANEELIAQLRGQAYTTSRPDQLCEQAATLLQSQAERIKDLEVDFVRLEATAQKFCVRNAFVEAERDNLRAQLAEIEANEPVAWFVRPHGGPEGLTHNKAVAERFDGKPLFTRPMPAQDVTELVEALEQLARLGNGEHYGNSDGNMIARDALSKYKGAK